MEPDRSWDEIMVASSLQKRHKQRVQIQTRWQTEGRDLKGDTTADRERNAKSLIASL